MKTANQIRRQFIDFFVKQHAHKEIPSASVVPENDPTVLFTTAGMHPLVPYLMGEPHPEGNRLTDAQKCVRTDDIDEVGDSTHLTFFEMLGNWSLGDYFKKEAITMSYELITKPWEEGGLGIDINRVSVACFEGDDDAPRDDESADVWRSLGIPENRIYFFPKKQNWWGPAGQTGPCGPDTEMFYDVVGDPDPTVHKPVSDALKKELLDKCSPACDCGRYVEFWNDVFMQYFKTADGKFEPLKQKNVDTGMGLERMTAILQGVDSPFETDLFKDAISKILSIAGVLHEYGKIPDSPNDRLKFSARVIADHLRSATFIIGDDRGVTPSNVDQGYILRRLIRRAIRYAKMIGIERAFTHEIAKIYIDLYKEHYPELQRNRNRILTELEREEEKFGRTLQNGLRELEKLIAKKYDGQSAAGKVMSGEDAFFLFETYGFPPEMTAEEGRNFGLDGVNMDEFNEAFKKHQAQSRVGAEQKFAGGLADHSEQCKMHHTATHLVHQALRDVLGDHVFQKGSNITKERLRFDFSHADKMTPEQIKQVEAIVNEQIQADLPIHFEVLEVDEAKERGAIGLFDDKYASMGNKVKVYFMGDYSKEVCGGPHVEHTGVLKHFKITKEQACSAGVRRIKAVVEGISDVA
ncbi:alanine--tRNA ligase [Candidatus Peregrinibacteria bacterium CG11_big_fil_rev_8_21_14_0_20_46_8]|nr:MAG: alanine--tRNA ligase [Candidatus Peregrinibacteria bacterium CG11_big_fil_rev_8_21_14_0_20_46_8]